MDVRSWTTGRGRDRRRRASPLDLLQGAPPALPPALDALLERWARAAPRARVAVGALAVVVVLSFAGHGATRSPWGPPSPAVLAAREIPAGTTITTEHVTVGDWPADLLPAGTFSDPSELVGQVVVSPVTAGMVIAPLAVTDGGMAAGLRAGNVAYPLEIEVGAPLSPGQVVDVIGADGTRGAQRLAGAAVVIAHDEGRIWLEVSRDEAPAIAAASAWGHVTLVLLPPGTR